MPKGAFLGFALQKLFINWQEKARVAAWIQMIPPQFLHCIGLQDWQDQRKSKAAWIQMIPPQFLQLASPLLEAASHLCQHCQMGKQQATARPSLENNCFQPVHFFWGQCPGQ